MLWRIKDATLGAANAPGWKTLFVQALGNFLMAYSSYRPLDRGEAARLEAFMNDRRTSVLGFLGRLGRPDWKGAERVFEREKNAGQHEAAVAAAGAVTPSEAAWLRSSLARDGQRDECEQALLSFLEKEGAKPGL
jgi:Ser/Thr protein kinase RdoA (MazF antagonist)